MNHNYESALNYLYGYTDYEKVTGYDYSPERFDLARVHRLLDLLGRPHHTFRSVHVAGTKGKGSTSAMVAAVLRAAGYRTGLYTSPHLHTFRERIQVDGELISEDDVVRGVDRLREVAPQVRGITTFELITALAFCYLAERRVEWAVLEVGMGGRLDATNVVTPEVAVITSISYDHMAYLGDTLSQIASEKAGIIKPGVPVVSAPQAAEALDTIARIAEERGAPLTLVGRDWLWSDLGGTSEGQRFEAWPAAAPAARQHYQIALVGRHQQDNAVTALAAVHQLTRGGLAVDWKAMQAGLASVRWPGRLEVLGREPWVIVDGAHNGDSMAKLLATLREFFPHQGLVLVLGVSADKDIGRMLDAIAPSGVQVLASSAHHPRAADAHELARRVQAAGLPCEAVAVEDAWSRALALAGPRDLICGTGSLFLVAELRARWLARTGQPLPPSDPE